MAPPTTVSRRSLFRATADKQQPPALARFRHTELGAPPPLPAGRVIALNRLAFGPRPGDLADFDALGGNDALRLENWVDAQLAPGSFDYTELNAKLAAANFESYGLSNDPDTLLATLWNWYTNGGAPSGNTSSTVPRDELVRATFTRAIYSPAQLVEVLTDYWHDHFSVNINHSTFVRAAYQHLDLVIRQNLLGRFRTLLEAVTKSTSMLYYLDNHTSSNAGPNENFCRELFEVQTLGAENYLGVMQQNQVPTDGQGRPIGYVDADVFEATRAFTGWSFSQGIDGDGDTGLFVYRSAWHDRFQKTVLGVFMPQDQPAMKDGHDVLDALAAHPGTGRHVARRMARRLLADEPSQALVDAAAAIFTAQWEAPDQLAQVVRTIVLHPDFLATWGEKVKRPFEIAAGALRTGGTTWTPATDATSSSFFSRFDDTGHDLFTWPAPNGFPDTRDAWTSMTPRVNTWRLCGWMIEWRDAANAYLVDVVAQTPAHVRSANELADFWIDRVLGRPMAPEDRAQLVQLMAQGINPDFDLDLSSTSTADRLRTMVGVIFNSPDFLWR